MRAEAIFTLKNYFERVLKTKVVSITFRLGQIHGQSLKESDFVNLKCTKLLSERLHWNSDQVVEMFLSVTEKKKKKASGPLIWLHNGFFSHNSYLGTKVRLKRMTWCNTVHNNEMSETSTADYWSWALEMLLKICECRNGISQEQLE